jgi:hypothetical protein
LIVVLVCDGVFDETTANQHRWLLIFQSKTSHKLRAVWDRPLPVNASFTNRRSLDCVCSLCSLVTTSFEIRTLVWLWECGLPIMDIINLSAADLIMGCDSASSVGETSLSKGMVSYHTYLDINQCSWKQSNMSDFFHF